MPRKLMLVDEERNVSEEIRKIPDEPDAPVEDSLVGGDEFDDDDDFEDEDEDFYDQKENEEDWQEPEEEDAQPEAPASEAPKETVPDPVVDVAWDEAKERKADEEAWLEQLQQARKEMEAAKSKLDNLKERVKIAKADHALALQTLTDLVEDGPQYRKKPEPPKAPAPVPAATATPSPAAADEEQEPEPTPEPIVEVEDWQSITTASLLEGIEGLGAKKREALIEAFPTLGKLEEARGEASKQFKSFKELLPRGIGEKIASELEEKMLQTIAKRTT